MKRKAIILALCASMALSVPMGVSATSVTDFTDVPADSWYYDDVKGAVDHGYMNGTSGSTFDPSNQMTRAMATTVFARFDEAVVDDSKPTIFTDVPVNQWYTGSIAWANEQKLVEGVGDNRFSPNNFISRQDMAVIMDRYIKNKGYSLKESPLIDSFKDASSISDYAREAVENCRKYGLINGYDDGTFGPKTDISRAQAAAMFERMKVVVDNNQITPEPPKPSGGGGGGGSSTTRTYSDYTVTMDLTAKSKSISNLPARNAGKTGVDDDPSDTEYHVQYNDGTYAPNSSDDIGLAEVIKDLFNEDSVRTILNSTAGQTVNVAGDDQEILIDKSDKEHPNLYYLNNSFVIAKVPVVSIVDPQDIVDAMSSGESATTSEVTAVLEALDNGEPLDDSNVGIAKKICEELDGLTNADDLMTEAINASGMTADQLNNLGISTDTILEMKNEYVVNLEKLIQAVDPTYQLSGRSITLAANESSSTGASSTKGGVPITVNLAQIIYDKHNENNADTNFETDVWQKILNNDKDLNNASNTDQDNVKKAVKNLYEHSFMSFLIDNTSMKDGKSDELDGKSDELDGKLKSIKEISTGLETIVGDIENIRKAYLKIDSENIADKLENIVKTSGNGIEIGFDNKDSLNTLLKKDAPTLEDMGIADEGATSYALNLKINNGTDLIKNVLNNPDVSADDIKEIGNKINGEYSVTIKVNRTVDKNHTSVH